MRVYVYDAGYLAELNLYDENENEFAENFIIQFSNNLLLKADDEVKTKHRVKYTLSEDDYNTWVSFLEKQQKIIDGAVKYKLTDILNTALQPSEILSFRMAN